MARYLPIVPILMLAMAGTSFLAACSHPPLQVMTVAGPIDAAAMGKTLIHEHVFLDWTGADSMDASQWDHEQAFAVIVPQLNAAKAQGIQTLLECTPAFLGRSPRLLKRLSEVTGLNLLTNTGLYGARQNRYLPEYATRESADEIAARWGKEAIEGIEGTGIRPGFIKIGVDDEAELSEIHEKIVRAAARAHLQTGLAIVGHTGPEGPAYAQLRILAEEGVAADAFIWTHAQRGSPEAHRDIAGQGGWISLDGMGWMAADSATDENALTLNRYVSLIQNLRDHQLLRRLLISHDAGWYTHGEADGGTYQPYTAISLRVVPALLSAGFSQQEIDQILILNPREAYAIRVRKRMY